ncbi:MAG: hypothetical protein K2X27_28070 [Candidatus Obscuribacterales bacterium]|nr:hypothetical protein [Candidatus Obscuribacterales bacterium]
MIRFLFNSLQKVLSLAWSINRPIAALFLISLVSFGLSLCGIGWALCAGDMQIELWQKSLKFSLSFMLYSFSLLQIAANLDSLKPLLKVTSLSVLIGAVLELSSIYGALLVAHFGSPLQIQASEKSLLLLARTAIIPVSMALPIFLFLLLRKPGITPLRLYGFCWGTALALLGLIPGLMMLMPAAIFHGWPAYLSSSSKLTLAQAIGHGELRTAHFFGIHALQIIPLAAYALEKSFLFIEEDRKLRLLCFFACNYAFAIGLLTLQALSGESFFAPSLSHLQAAGIFLLFSFLAIPAVLFCPRLRELTRPEKAFDSHL